MKEIEYKTNVRLETAQIIKLYKNCGLPRPVTDETRITEMFANSNLVISAWYDGELICK